MVDRGEKNGKNHRPMVRSRRYWKDGSMIPKSLAVPGWLLEGEISCPYFCRAILSRFALGEDEEIFRECWQNPRCPPRLHYPSPPRGYLGPSARHHQPTTPREVPHFPQPKRNQAALGSRLYSLSMMSSSSSSSSRNAESRKHAMITHVPLTGNLSSCCPLFVDDFSALICASGSLIQSISSKTGELIGSFTGHTALVTCIRSIGTASSPNTPTSVTEDPLHPTKHSIHVISSSIDGMVIVWNKKSFQEVSRVLVHAPVYDIIIPSSSLQGTFLGGSHSSIPADRVGRISVLSSSSQSSSSSGIRPPSSSSSSSSAASADEETQRLTTANNHTNKHNELYLVLGKKQPQPQPQPQPEHNKKDAISSATSTSPSPSKSKSIHAKSPGKGQPQEGGDVSGYQLVCYDPIACKIRYNLSSV